MQESVAIDTRLSPRGEMRLVGQLPAYLGFGDAHGHAVHLHDAAGAGVDAIYSIQITRLFLPAL